MTGTELTATFNEPMDPATINSSPAGTQLTFTLKETAGSDVPGTVAMNAAGTVATFTPSASALTPNTGYTATVTTAAESAGGTPMANPVSWSFTTNATPFTGQAPVNLGQVCDSAIFADTGIANATFPAAITGDMGVGPGVTSTAITGPWALSLPPGGTYSTSNQVIGKVYAHDYAPPTPAYVTTASTDMGAAYTDAAGRLSPDFVNLAGGSLDGQVLIPGLYRWNSDVTLSVGADVTLAGGPDDVWIIQITGTLATGAGSNVLLTGGASACNVFWQVAGTSVALGANSHFEGTVLAKNAINLVNQASVNGRLLAQTAVNLDENTVTQLCGCDGGGSVVTGPTVVSTNPSNGATDVPTSTNGSNNVVTGREVTATFSEPMDAATINSSPAGAQLTFTLKETAGSDVPGTVAMNADSTVATFTPTAPSLLPNTSYTATVTTAAESSGGTAMANSVSWSFTTQAAPSIGQAPVELGMAGDYAIFADTGITNAGYPAAITGNMGVGPGVTSTAIIGFALDLPSEGAFSTSAQVIGKVYAFDYAPPTPANVTTASTDMGAAYADAAGRLFPDFLNLAGGDLGGQVLTPGLYRWDSDVTLPFGTNVTLSGGPNDVWIFQITGSLTTGAGTSVILTGGARAENIFWQVGGTSVTVGANAHFAGVILAKEAINLGNEASVEGRLLSQTAVTIDQDVITEPAP